MAHNPFTHHPREVGESYGEHLAHAGVSGLRLVGSGIAKRVDAPNWERHPII